MAETDWGALTPMQKKVWQAETWKQARDKSFWFSTGMMSSGTSDASKPVHYVRDLTATARGVECVMHLVPDLVGDGTAGDRLMKGREESLTADDESIVLDQLRHAVRSRGTMSEQKTVIRFRETARDTLANWASQKIDELAFLTVSGRAYTLNLDGSTRDATSHLSLLAFAGSVTAPTANRSRFGDGTGTGDITTAGKLLWSFVVTARAYAARKRLKPIRMNGKDCYCLVAGPEAIRDLKNDANYNANVGRAAARGKDNPLFTGYISEVDGIYIFEHPKVCSNYGGTLWGAGTNVQGQQCLLLGAQALGFARIGDPKWVEDKDDDYENQDNVGYSMKIGMKKPVFASQYDAGAAADFGAMSLYVAAAA